MLQNESPQIGIEAILTDSVSSCWFAMKNTVLKDGLKRNLKSSNIPWNGSATLIAEKTISPSAEKDLKAKRCTLLQLFVP